ncbi:MAG: transglutaminase-like enzyme, putative cysteine protease, partial [halophilic archaeon J07HX5]
ITLAVFGLGMLWYLAALSYVPSVLGVLASNVELLTGRTLLRVDAVGRWVVVATPTLAFATWFLVLRRRYIAGAGVGAGAVSYLVLTGDAGTMVTLLGVVSTVGVIGSGDLERHGGSGPGIERLALVLAVMVIAPVLVTVVPGGSASPVSLTGGTQPSIESAVVTQNNLEIVGSVDQSPRVRFEVTGDEPRRWRTAAFDRYTGDGWVRTGDRTAAELTAPAGETRTRTYEYALRSQFSAIPTAWQPTTVTNLSSPTLQTSTGGLQVDGQLPAGEQYTVTAAVPNASRTAVETAGQAYPAAIADTYTQLPDSTPDRVATRTSKITQQATNPYETAVVIEEWLETNRGYSLDVDRPTGDIADAFLFEMEVGYCTYYATTMVAMLRSQEVPARLAVGYTPGEPV